MKTIHFVSLLLVSTNVLAWGDLGHGAIGYIAEHHLTPEGKGFIYSIMGAEPLATSAIYPDHVRDDGRYDEFATYHYIETNKTAEKSADTMVEEVPKLVLRKKNPLSIQQKQVLLRYFIHIVGDLHQPLHVGNGLDRGGNNCDVMFTEPNGSTHKMNLHSVWDNGIVDHLKEKISSEAYKKKSPIKYFSYRPLALWLVDTAKLDGSYNELVKLAETTSKKDWYAEAQALHVDVYPDAKPIDPKERSYCFGGKKLPALSDDYIQKSIGIVKKRLLLGGLRLANAINQMAKEAKAKAWTQKNEEDFFAPIMPVAKK